MSKPNIKKTRTKKQVTESSMDDEIPAIHDDAMIDGFSLKADKLKFKTQRSIKPETGD